VDVRTDIYALGTTLFHLVCGRQPFIGPSAGVVASKNLSEPLPNPRELNPDLSDPFCSFLIKLTEKKEEDRYQTPDEVIHAIDQILSGVATVQSPAARDDASATQSRPVRSTFLGRNRTPILASLGLLLAVGAAAAFLHLRNRDDQPRRLIRRKTPERSTSLSPGGRAFIAGTGVKENPDRPQPKPVTIRGSSKAQWQVLDPLQYSSTGGSTMKKLADHSVLATGIIPLGNSFQVVARTDIPKITAIRLEVLTHENFKVRSLSYESGSYLVTTFEASIKRERQPMANIPFEPRQAVSDYVYRKPIWRVDKAVDGDKLTGWSGTSSKVSRYANQRTAVFYPAQSVLAGRGTTLVISILNDRADRESMGRFRLAVSSASSPKWNGSSSVPVKLDAKVLE
ncbi:MAG: hypothetical protein QF473_28980, partial [Planctomycetota bacterium]|nr:hypothetical protein [Planctomycetota bacterium]